jgi:gamma-glutamyltranspeptidase/glutathione hydrolase
MLRLGGSAIDAVVAGAFAATVAEPTLASLGGGGFCLVAAAGEAPYITDFFVDMPGRGERLGEPAPMTNLSVTFGSGTQQEFHVGWSSVAVPGTLAGLLDLHARGGRLPLREVISPALAAARDGIVLDEVQVAFIRVIGPILRLTPASAEIYAPPLEGRPFHNPVYADMLARLAEGEDPDTAFAEPVVEAMAAHGGLVTREDLASYAVAHRAPVRTRRGDAWIWTNPPPAFGGAIVLESLGLVPTTEAPWQHVPGALRRATQRHRFSAQVPRGTTHLSVLDGEGRVAALSLSNGSGSGTVAAGVALNNMLGEADLHPGGFHSLAPGERLSSMMAPTLVVGDDGSLLALGTGGSERIRSALTQVLLRTLDLDEDVTAAINAPRLHASEELIDIEPGFPEPLVAWMAEGHSPLREWPSADLYFGGVHAVSRDPDGRVTAAADLRRGGAVAVV